MLAFNEWIQESTKAPSIKSGERGGLVVDGKIGVMHWDRIGKHNFLFVASSSPGLRDRVAIPHDVDSVDIPKWVSANWDKIYKKDWDLSGKNSSRLI